MPPETRAHSSSPFHFSIFVNPYVKTGSQGLLPSFRNVLGMPGSSLPLEPCKENTSTKIRRFAAVTLLWSTLNQLAFSLYCQYLLKCPSSLSWTVSLVQSNFALQAEVLGGFWKACLPLGHKLQVIRTQERVMFCKELKPLSKASSTSRVYLATSLFVWFAFRIPRRS